MNTFRIYSIILLGLSTFIAGDCISAPYDLVSSLHQTSMDSNRQDFDHSSQINSWKIELNRLQVMLKRPGLTSSELEEIRKRAVATKNETIRLSSSIEPKLEVAQKLLDKLTTAFKLEEMDSPSPELEKLNDERAKQETVTITIDATMRQLVALQLQLEGLIAKIAEMRRKKLTQALFAKQSSIFDPNLWWEAVASSARFITSMQLLLYDWNNLLVTKTGNISWPLTFIVLLAALVTIVFAKKCLIAIVARNPRVTPSSDLNKFLGALALFAIELGFWGICLIVIKITLTFLDLNPGRIGEITNGLLRVIIESIAIGALGVAVLSPATPQWRLVKITDMDSMRIVYLLMSLAVVHGLGKGAEHLLVTIFTHGPLVAMLTGASVLADVALIMLTLTAWVGASSMGSEAITHKSQETAGLQSSEEDITEQDEHSVLRYWVIPLIWIISLSAILAAAVGYLAFARLLVTELIWGGVMLGIAILFLTVLDEFLGTKLLRSGSRFSEKMRRHLGISYSTLEQIGVIISGIARLIFVIPAFLIILMVAGVQLNDVWDMAYDIFPLFNLGGFLSPYAIISGLVIFTICLGMTRASQHWLSDRLLPRTRLDNSVKESIRTTFGYVGFILAVIIGFLTAGIRLDHIAIVAGALSVGVGFGLQSVVNNFVSGLILLVERPIKIGDIVIIGSEKGIVRKINIRSTEIETFDRASLIVPNSSLISGNVKNWMHRDLTGRCLIEVLVRGDVDMEKAKNIFLSCAAEHQQVLFFPMPTFTVNEFVDNAVRLCLICVIGNAGDVFFVESDLRIAILSKLRENGIALAPSRYVLVGKDEVEISTNTTSIILDGK